MFLAILKISHSINGLPFPWVAREIGKRKSDKVLTLSTWGMTRPCHHHQSPLSHFVRYTIAHFYKRGMWSYHRCRNSSTAWLLPRLLPRLIWPFQDNIQITSSPLIWRSKTKRTTTLLCRGHIAPAICTSWCVQHLKQLGNWYHIDPKQSHRRMANALISGYQNNLYKGFRKLDDAISYLEDEGHRNYKFLSGSFGGERAPEKGDPLY